MPQSKHICCWFSRYLRLLKVCRFFGEIKDDLYEKDLDIVDADMKYDAGNLN